MTHQRAIITNNKDIIQVSVFIIFTPHKRVYCLCKSCRPQSNRKNKNVHPVQPSGNTGTGKHARKHLVLNYTRGARTVRNRNRQRREKEIRRELFKKTWLEMPRSRWQCLNRMCVEGLRDLFHPCQGEC